MTEEEITEVLVGELAYDHLTIRPLGRLHPDAFDYWDGNWLATNIDVSVGGFRGSVGTALRAEELREFRDALVALNRSLDGEAVLRSMEEWITLRISADKSGHLKVTGTLRDGLGDSNQLTFKI